jgi:hypothetical protein
VRSHSWESTLAKEKIAEKMTFNVKQVPAYVYGRDYFLGDLVDARYLDYESWRSRELL